MQEDKTYIGTVVWFNPKKGFGFIERDGDKDIFVHYTDIIMDNDEQFKTLSSGDKVSFNITDTFKGKLKACNVRLTEKKSFHINYSK